MHESTRTRHNPSLSAADEGGTRRNEAMMLSTAPAVGELVPDLVLPTLDGTTIRVSDFRGQRLLIFMWASW